MKAWVLASLFCLFLIIPVIGQQSAGQETSPAGMKWFQINTEHFKVLYPDGFGTEAQRVANTLEHIREPEASSLGIVPKKISIVLHSQSAISNGFVTLAPRRSEFFAMPPQNYNFTGTNEWLTLLSSHEYRHIVQFQKSVTGFNKAIYFLFGQLAQAGMAFIAVPQWFWEGDAVATETAFTGSGRGRIPEFDLLFRTNFLEGRNFDYNKQYLRSFRHNVPDHYVLGYHMVSYLRKKTGKPDIWRDITKRAWGVPFVPFTFSSAIKKESGMYVKELYDEMAGEIKKDWESQQRSLKLTSFQNVNIRQSDAYTDYSYPQPLPDGRVVALKSGIGDFSQFVTITADGVEEKCHVPGPINDAGMLSVSGDKLVWNEYRVDPRWQTRSYSIIKGFDFNIGKRQVVAKRVRFGAAAISPDGSKVVTVETDNSYQNKLVVLDFNSGAVLKKFENPDNHLLTMPRWSRDGKEIVFIELSGGEKRIAKINLESGLVELLYDAGSENVGHPVLHDDFLLYNSPLSGIDNIYAINLRDKSRYQVTSGKYGTYNPSISPDGKTIFYNNQTRDGLDIVKMPFSPDAWSRVERMDNAEGLFSDLLAEQEGQPNLMESIPARKYDTKRYHRSSGMINPHSWGVYTTSSFNTLDFGISSKDILSTTLLDAGYSYDVTERTGFWRADISYQGMYPILDVAVRYGNRASSEDFFDGSRVRTVNFEWEEVNAEAGLRIPLITTQSKYSSSISIGNSVGLTHVLNFKNDINNGGRFFPVDTSRAVLFRTYIDGGDLVFNHFNFEATHLLKRSRRDINSKWGQTIRVNYFSTPYLISDYAAEQFSAVATAYFPGLLKHHSFWGYGGYQHSLINDALDGARPNNYLFRNQVPAPRGHSVSRFQDYYVFAANYTFPIIYPDLALGPILNIQRVRGNAFFDYAYGQSKLFGFDSAYSSVGGELKFDFNVMRLLQQFNLGVRYAYPFETKSPVIELIIGNIGF